MRNYVYTVRGARSEEDAVDFLVSILSTEYCDAAGDEAKRKGFKRSMAQSDSDINNRLTRLHAFSEGEYSYKGTDEFGLFVYTFWGVTSFQPRIPQPEAI